jgi:hypothetical protein
MQFYALEIFYLVFLAMIVIGLINMVFSIIAMVKINKICKVFFFKGNKKINPDKDSMK